MRYSNTNEIIVVTVIASAKPCTGAKGASISSSLWIASSPASTAEPRNDTLFISFVLARNDHSPREGSGFWLTAEKEAFRDFCVKFIPL